MTVLLGVDFGTSNTVAVLRFPDGRARPLLFDGSPIMPSAVFADDTTLLIGRDAEHSARVRPERFEPNPKRRIDDGTVRLGGREVEVVDLFAAVLRRVWVEASRIVGTGGPIEVTLTHPAAWGQVRIALLVEGARRAGMGSPRLVPEPVAAAAYFVGALNVDIPIGGAMVIYDFGAGTFDASVLRREPGGFAVLASEGLNDAGGLDIEAAVVGYLGATIVARDADAWQRLDRPATDSDRRSHRLFREDVRAAKEILSRTSSTYVHVPIIDDSLPIGREQLETLARPVLDRTVSATRLAIRRAGLGVTPPAAIFLVGGSSRIPLAATLLHRALGIVPSAVEQPELVVADGSVHASAVAVAATAPIAPVSGIPVSSAPVSGIPVSATPVTGIPVSGQPVSGYPGAATYPPPPLPPQVPAPAAPYPPAQFGAAPAPAAPAAPPTLVPGRQPPAPAAPSSPAPTGPASPATPGQVGPPAPLWPSQPPAGQSPLPGQSPVAGQPGVPAAQPAGVSAVPPPVTPTVTPTGQLYRGPIAPGQAHSGAAAAGPVHSGPIHPGQVQPGAGQGGSAPVTGPLPPAPATPTGNVLSGQAAPTGPVPTTGPLWPAAQGGPSPISSPPSSAPPTSGWRVPPVGPPGSGAPLAPPEPPRRGRGKRIALITVPAVLVAAAVVAALVVRPWQHEPPPVGPKRTTAAISYEAGDNTGPAARPADAQRGGRLTVLSDAKLDHLDPAQVIGDEEVAIDRLVTRTLTAIRTNADGSGTLVGDLATNPGEDLNGDCKTWSFTLRPGVMYASGAPITSRDVAYGIARSFDPDFTSGFITLQQWLANDKDYSSDYKGPGSGNTPAPGIRTPDDSTVVFSFDEPHCDLPYAASLANTAPIPVGTHQSADTLDNRPPASGAYQVDARTESSLTLSRNPYWSAASDPLRTGDPDEIVIQLGLNGDNVAQKLITDADSDQRTISWAMSNTAAARATNRVTAGPLGYQVLLIIDTRRIASLAIRQAISYAINKEAMVAESGKDAGEPATGLIAPGQGGYQPGPDPYPYDRDTAKQLVGRPGSPVPITLAIAKNSVRQKQSLEIQKDLDAIGFKTSVIEVDSFAAASGTYDLAMFGYLPWWASGYEQLVELFGSGATDNLAHLDDPAITAEFDRLAAVPAAQQVAGCAELAAKILRDTAAAVPLFTPYGTYLFGSHVGPVPVSAAFRLPDLATAYVTG